MMYIFPNVIGGHVAQCILVPAVVNIYVKSRQEYLWGPLIQYIARFYYFLLFPSKKLHTYFILPDEETLAKQRNCFRRNLLRVQR